MPRDRVRRVTWGCDCEKVGVRDPARRTAVLTHDSDSVLANEHGRELGIGPELLRLLARGWAGLYADI